MFYLNPHILRPFLFILLNYCYDVQSIGFFDSKEHLRIEIVVFSNQLGFTRRQAFDWLYFGDSFINVHCQLRYHDNDTDANRNFLVKKYASQGMSPSLTLSSPTWSKTFEFAPLVHGEKWTYWTLNISKAEDFTDISFHRKVPWKFKVELQKGLKLFETRGSLVVSDTEPLLNVKLGDDVLGDSPIHLLSPPNGVIRWHSPCTSGVTALVPRLNLSEMPFTGCYMAVTHAGFSSNTTHWHNLLHLSTGTPDAYSICKEAEFSSCSNLAILDFTIVHDYMLVVTTKGLIRSQQMNEALHDPEYPKLKFYAVQTGHPELDKLFEDSVQPTDIKLHHTVHCFSHLNTERSRVYLRFSPKQTNSHLQQSVVLVSEAPFMQWKALEFREPMANLPVVGIVEDFQRQTTVMLLHETNQARALVAVRESNRDIGYFHPAYRFPAYVTFNGMTLHSYTNVLFAYGSQVWQSLDGGNSFHKIIELRPAHDLVSSFFVQDHGDSFTCVTHLGRSYHGKSGIQRAVPLELGNKLSNRSLKTFVMEQQSGVYLLTLPDASNLLSLKSESLDLKSHFVTLGGFFYWRPLLVRLITPDRVELFTYCKDAFFSSEVIRCNESFQSSDVGRVLRTRSGAVVMLDNISTEPKAGGFSGPAIGHVLTPISPDNAVHTPALRSAVELNWLENNATLVLLNVTSGSGWKGEDVGKTVYFPDGNAVILSTYVNASVARAHSQSRWTNLNDFVKVYRAGLWSLIDFRPFDARRPKEGQVLCVGKTGVGQAPVMIPVGTFFLNSDVGKVLKAGQGWGFVTSVTSGSTATINIFQAMNGNHTENWGLYEANATQDGGAPTAQELWWLEEDECRQFLVKDSNSDPSFYHLDSNENLSLTVRAISMSDATDTKPLLRMFIGNASLFLVESYYSFSKLNHSLHVTIKQRPYVSGEASVTFRLDQTSLLCKDSSYVVMIYGGCPPSKKLIFSYPLSLTEDFLHREVKDKKGIVRNLRLPYNYRPPSSRGTGIPMSENIYNAYPEKPPYRSAYAITRETARYKQCAGKKDRHSCGCTTARRMSSLVLHSDCIDTVYRVLFTDTLKPRFTVSQEGPLKFPYYLEELNGRSDFEIISPYTEVFATSPISSPIMNQELNSSIEFQGSGLYHFRAHVVQENYTFCKLTDEFLVYVDETPLPSPVNDIVRACTGMAFTAMLSIVYLWTFHGKKKINEK